VGAPVSKGPNGTVGFTFSWDDLAADGHGDRVAALMSNLFFSSNAAPVVAASPGSPTLSSVLSLPKGQVWLVLASRERFEDAVDFATRYGSPGVRVVKSMNGWFAVLDGPTDVDSGRAHIQSGTLVEPAYLSGGERFIETVWQRPKEQVATNAPAHPTEVVSSGSSVLVSQEGYLITNEHVIAGCASLNAVGIGKVIVAGQHKINDLALLKSNTKSSAEPLPLSTSPTRLGQEVIGVSTPGYFGRSERNKRHCEWLIWARQ
jgi:S1-C subfamily serine protease